jgi:hypothetical protein
MFSLEFCLSFLFSIAGRSRYIFIDMLSNEKFKIVDVT